MNVRAKQVWKRGDRRANGDTFIVDHVDATGVKLTNQRTKKSFRTKLSNLNNRKRGYVLVRAQEDVPVSTQTDPNGDRIKLVEAAAAQEAKLAELKAKLAAAPVLIAFSSSISAVRATRELIAGTALFELPGIDAARPLLTSLVHELDARIAEDGGK